MPLRAHVVRAMLRRCSEFRGQLQQRRWRQAVAVGHGEDMVSISEQRLEEFMRAELMYLASTPARPVSMHQVLNCTLPRASAKFIQEDVPKRFALRIRMIETLNGWQSVPELVHVHDRLCQWFQALLLVDRSPAQGLKQFTDCVKTIRAEGHDTVGMVAAGMHRLHVNPGCTYDEAFLDRWLDDFLLSRIGSNMLIDQYRASLDIKSGGLGKATGVIDKNCNATLACQQAASAASMLCQRHTGKMPRFVVENYMAGLQGPQPHMPCLFSYIPSYLRYIMVELLKNSFHATAINSKTPAQMESRPVQIIVCCDEQRVAIRVSDKAGGIPFDVGDRIWSYLYGAAARSRDGSCKEKPTGLAGYGVGLPLSRLHARYLGGKLEVTSFPGYGTDAYLFLPRIDADQVEEMPRFHDAAPFGPAEHHVPH